MAKAAPMTTNSAKTQPKEDKAHKETEHATNDEHLTPKQTAERISKLSVSGDPYEFTDVDEAKDVYSYLDNELFTWQEYEGGVRITRV